MEEIMEEEEANGRLMYFCGVERYFFLSGTCVSHLVSECAHACGFVSIK